MLKAAREGNLIDLQNVFTITHPYTGTRDNHGWTALHHAVFGDHYEVIQFLLQLGTIAPETKTYEGETALFLALKQGSSIHVIKALLAVGRNIVNINNNEMISPLMTACSELTLEYVVALVEAGANINNQDDMNMQTALSIAVESKKYDIVQYLLYNGADCAIQDYCGLTPLMIAASQLNSPMEMIIDFTVDINTVNYEGVTALMLTAQTGDYNNIDILLRNGADVMILADDGTSALSYALYQGCVRNVKRILDEITDEQLSSLMDITKVQFSILYLALKELNIDAESITITERFAENISRNAVVEYDRKYEGMITHLIDSYLPKVIRRYPAHAEYLLQVLLMKGLSFDDLLTYLPQAYNRKLFIHSSPKRVLHIFNLLIKYGYNPSLPPEGYSYLYKNYTNCAMRVKGGKYYGLSIVQSTSSRDKTTVRSLQELSAHCVAKLVKTHNQSTQRYLIAISKLHLPKTVIHFLLNINE